MSLSRGQGAFEYLMSYGWAVLIVIVLGVVLWNLGVFNPSQGQQATGFSVLRPISWSFTNASQANSSFVITLTNIGGFDVLVNLNG